MEKSKRYALGKSYEDPFEWSVIDVIDKCGVSFTEGQYRRTATAYSLEGTRKVPVPLDEAAAMIVRMGHYLEVNHPELYLMPSFRKCNLK